MKVISTKYHDLSKFKAEFLSSMPFPHLILDNFLDEEFFQKISASQKSLTTGKSFNTLVEEKKWISLNSDLPGAVSEVVNALNSEEWKNNMESLCSLPQLEVTDLGNSSLANFHMMGPGGILGSHVDHSSEPETGKPHVLNIILYLSSEWKEGYGGATELFDKRGKKVLKRVSYIPNRAVVFLHTPFSFHGVERISADCPENRKSIYVDYYSKSFRPYEKLELGFSNRWFEHGTTFKLMRYSDYLKRCNRGYLKALLKYQVNRLISLI